MAIGASKPGSVDAGHGFEHNGLITGREGA